MFVYPQEKPAGLCPSSALQCPFWLWEEAPADEIPVCIVSCAFGLASELRHSPVDAASSMAQLEEFDSGVLDFLLLGIPETPLLPEQGLLVVSCVWAAVVPATSHTPLMLERSGARHLPLQCTASLSPLVPGSGVLVSRECHVVPGA